MSGTQPNAESVVQPQSAFHCHFQPLPPPQALDSLVIHLPSGIAQHGRNPAIAIVTMLSSHLNHVGDQPILLSPPLQQLALCRTMVAQHLAGPTLGNPQLTRTCSMQARRRAGSEVSLPSPRDDQFVQRQVGHGTP